jgi:hypothetical protein
MATLTRADRAATVAADLRKSQLLLGLFPVFSRFVPADARRVVPNSFQ